MVFSLVKLKLSPFTSSNKIIHTSSMHVKKEQEILKLSQWMTQNIQMAAIFYLKIPNNIQQRSHGTIVRQTIDDFCF